MKIAILIFTILLQSSLLLATDFPGRNDRPAPSELLEAWSPFSSIPEYLINAKSGADITQDDLKLLAEIIVKMEAAYPNAVWAPMGRDTAMFADVLDAFYLSLGQKNRVRRLNGSGASIRGQNAEVLNQFLEYSGLDYQNPLKQPFILIDATTWNHGSQMTQLIAAAYQALNQKGFNSQQLFSKINGINIYDNGSGSKTFITPETLQKYFADVELQENSFGNNIRAAIPSHILSIDKSHAQHQQLRGKLWYTLEWHSTFSFQLNPFFQSIPGASSFHSHVPELSTIYKWFKIVTDKQFHQLVKETAKKMGYPVPEALAPDYSCYRQIIGPESRW